MWKIIKWTLLTLIIAVIAYAGITSYKGYQLYRDTMDGVDLAAVFSDFQELEGYVESDEIPTMFLNALIAVEDHRFMDHAGFDVISFGRAIIRNVMENEFAAGGSTITQQLSKNLFFSFEKKMERKVAELIVAKQIEEGFEKKEILEMYVNIIYFGDGYEGISAASRGYFEKDPSQLTDAECVLLAGLPQAPSAYALREHFDMALERSHAVLQAMVEHGYLLEHEMLQLKKDIETIKIQVE